MPTKRYTVEQIIHKLREAEVLLAQGLQTGAMSKKLGVAEQTYYRSRQMWYRPQSGQAAEGPSE